MPRLPRPLAGLLLTAGAALAAAPPASANLAERVTSPKAQVRNCIAAPTTGTGVVRRELTAPADGLVRATLANGAGDWDVAVFGRDGRFITGGAGFGAREVAEGVVVEGERLVVQVCRRRGDGTAVDLAVRTTALPAPAESKVRLVRVALPVPAAQDLLDTLGLDVTEHARPGLQDVVIYSDEELLRLTKAGLTYTLIDADMVGTSRRGMRAAAASPVTGPGVPSGRTEYRRLPDYDADMKRLAEQHPNLVKPLTLRFPTLEGRPVHGIEITRDVNARDGKPVFVQMGVHHAREWPSAEHAMEWAFELVNGHAAGDQRVVDLLGRTRVIVVPVVNPDGFNLSREAMVDVPVGPAGLLAESVLGTDFAYKRRNCRVRDGQLPAVGECALPANRTRGTDPNRNYGGLWGGAGASTLPTNDTYRGAGPFSEPETQNVKDLVINRQVTTLITNHTYSDLVLRPPGVAAQGAAPDEPIYKAFGQAMADQNGYKSEQSFGLYDTTGTTEDYTYYATGGLGFTFEIGKAADGPTGFETLAGVGFHPPYPLGVIAEYRGKQPTGDGNRGAYFVALEHTANASKHAVVTGTAPAGSRLRVEKTITTDTSAVVDAQGTPGPVQTFADTLTSTTDVGSTGRFTWHMNPSTRPGLDRERRISGAAATPFSTRDIGSPTPTASKQVAFRVEPGQVKLVRAAIDAAAGDDYDLYLYKGTTVNPLAEVASSATEAGDETINYADPAPGDYVLEVRFFTATAGYTGSLELYGEDPGSVQVIPGVKEAWALTCTRPDGKTTQPRKVQVDRGATLDLGDACKLKGGSRPKG